MSVHNRYNRKYGIAVDTAGGIARALERAYRDGVGDGRTGIVPNVRPLAAEDGPIEWALIPPRPRSAFWSIGLFTLGRGDTPAAGGCLVAAITERGTEGWQLSVKGRSCDKSIGEKTIIPLVRLGLIEPAPDEPRRLVVSQRGVETWRLFLQRGGRYPEDLTDL